MHLSRKHLVLVDNDHSEAESDTRDVCEGRSRKPASRTYTEVLKTIGKAGTPTLQRGCPLRIGERRRAAIGESVERPHYNIIDWLLVTQQMLQLVTARANIGIQ
uniref:Uncharacterized protein n=1 Tax=Steinernema glaseri TaxID=37863 RepID=A0A1I8AIE3_9BILA